MINKTINREIFRCPNCGQGKLLFIKNVINCTGCSAIYRFKGNKIFFIQRNAISMNDPLGRLKYKLKKYNILYSFLVNIISPVYTRNHLRKFIKTEIEKAGVTSLNLGSGNISLSNKLINVDLFPFDNVDIVADIHMLPFLDETIDAIVCSAVLEHVQDPYRVVSEIHRVLKKKGITYCYMPFIQGFHSSPYDYTRLTYEGMKILFRNFEIIELGVGGGPTSGLLWVLQEWLSILLSFGSKKLQLALYLFFMTLTFPIKYLDFLLARHPMSKNIACGFYIVARKNGNKKDIF